MGICQVMLLYVVYKIFFTSYSKCFLDCLFFGVIVIRMY